MSVESQTTNAVADQTAAAVSTPAAKPHLPHLEGYKSPHANKYAPKWVFNIFPEEFTKWLPRNWRDVRRMKVSSRLYYYFDGRVIIQRIIGTSAIAISSWLFICWLDGVSPYLAVSEDPNTAFQHPHWLKVANERAAREREMRQRLESSGGLNSIALDHATKSYSSNQVSDRLS
jgi:hypothetical protein